MPMFRSCQKCGKVHPYSYDCSAVANVKTSEDRLRSKSRWTKKSLQVRDDANHMCEVCRAEGRITTEGLEVHHIEKLRDEPDMLLEDDNLICLCRKHHEEADAGMIDKEMLKAIAAKRIARANG